MIELKGKYNSAKVFSNKEEYSALDQIKLLLNQEYVSDSKIRVMPDYHAGAGCVIGLTMTIKDKVCPNLVGVDIGCLDKDTEFLTEEGWKPISEYQDGDKVLQYDKKTDQANFVTPINYIKEDCDEMYHFKNEKGLDQMLSEEHRMLIWKGFKSKGYNLEVFSPKEIVEKGDTLNNGYYGVKCAFEINNGEGINFSDDEIRLDVMIAADGYIKKERDSDNLISIHLKKERKIKRTKEILEANSIPFKEYFYSDGSVDINFYLDKKFNKSLKRYYKASLRQLEILASESLKWDGHEGYRSFFSSTNKETIDVIQFAFSSVNIRAGIYSAEKEKEENWKKQYNVVPTKNNIIGVTNTVSKVKTLDGKKYCFTVPSSYFVARRNGKIFITGNCGVLVNELGKVDIDLPFLDNFIRNHIPHGINKNPKALVEFDDLNDIRAEIDIENSLRSIGSLGSGNHFVEVNEDSEGVKYLVIHSGSRHLGLEVAKYYQKIAEEDCNKNVKELLINTLKRVGRKKDIERKLKEIVSCNKELSYLNGKAMEDYLHDIEIVQRFASLNREVMAKRILEFLEIKPVSTFESIHNYIDLERNILRKGAIDASEGKKVIIPINMRDGSIIGLGKGNEDYNFSAPHGAGRLMSRSKAKELISLEDFEESMRDVYSSSVKQSTIDESPFAYKSLEDIVDNVEDSVEILKIVKPIYNFKAD